ncbi:myosin heavy chain, striated muscle-like [Mytilus trossulus]|uniref:myosin heavy chain, striated muscle-like n=1 Tax=Mytilus trossulus TaxID=6551 RepID=UPI0030047C04
MNYSCQDLEKFVAPVLNQQMAPLMAIVDTTNISSHIVRSIEKPLREMVNAKFDALQQKMDEHMEDNRNQLTEVNQDIATLRKEIEERIKQDIVSLQKEIEERITHEILDKVKNLTRTVSTENKDLNVKVKNLTSKMDAMQLELQQEDELIGDNRNQMTEVKQDIATLRKEMEERITREIIDKVNNLTRAISNVNTNQDEKMKKLANNMDGMKLELQKKIEEHMGDDRTQMTGVKQDIMSLRKEMEERIVREIRDKLKNLTRNFSIEKKDLDEKVKKLTNTVDLMQTDLKDIVVSVDSNVTNLAEKLENHLSNLEMLRSNLLELTVNTSTIQTVIGNIKTSAEIDNGRLSVQVSKLEDLKATVNDMNLRVALSACVSPSYTAVKSTVIKFQKIITSQGITYQHLTSFKSSGVFVCEVPGLYYISVVIISKTHDAQFIISKNDIELMRGYINDYNTGKGVYWQSSAAIMVTELQKADRIDIKPSDKDMMIAGYNYSCLTIVKVK